MAPDFRSYLGECNTWYGFMSEDKGQYDVGWQPLKNESLYNPPFTYEAWEFNTSDELDTIPMMGKFIKVLVCCCSRPGLFRVLTLHVSGILQ